MATEGINIFTPPEENVLKGSAVTGTFLNQNELKGLLTAPNGKILDNGEIAVQYKSEF
jgi:hypothetical protein